MQWNININQVGIAEYALWKKTDMADWAILEYVKNWFFSGQWDSIVVDGAESVWIDYKYLIKEMPCLKINDPDCIGERIDHLKELNLIQKTLIPVPGGGRKVYIRPTDLTYQIWNQKGGGTENQRTPHRFPNPV